MIWGSTPTFVRVQTLKKVKVPGINEVAAMVKSEYSSPMGPRTRW